MPVAPSPSPTPDDDPTHASNDQKRALLAIKQRSQFNEPTWDDKKPLRDWAGVKTNDDGFVEVGMLARPLSADASTRLAISPID